MPSSFSSTLSDYGLASGRKSCEFTSHSVTCIQKARINLSFLQDGLEKWKTDLKEHTKQVQEQQENKLLQCNEARRPTHEHRLEAIKSGTTLEVFGDEIAKPTIVTVQNYNDHDGCSSIASLDDVPKLYTEVVQNTLTLLDRIERDRSAVALLLEKEQNRTKTLRENIDLHAYKRIHDLPQAVQEEHEKCAFDVQELKWHCAYRGRVEMRIKEKVRVSGNTNKKILEEIDFVKKNSPLINDKLNLENDSMLIIKNKQSQTDDKLKAAEGKLNDTELTFEQTKKKADIEQKILAERILSLSDELNSTLGRFLKSQEDHASMNEDIAAMEKQITSDDSESILIDKRLNRIEALEKIHEEKLEVLTEQIFKQTSEFKKLTTETEQIEEKVGAQSAELDNMKKSLERSIRNKTNDLRKLMRANKNSSNELQNLKKKIENCEKQKKSDIKSVKRCLAEKDKVTTDLKVIKEETDQTRSRHEKLLLKLDQERVKSSEIEENLEFQSDALKKQSKDESHARMILQARINANMVDFVKMKEESEAKKEKLIQMDTDYKRILETVKNQVERLSAKYEDRLKAIDGITKLRTQVSEKHTEQEKTLSEEIMILTPQEEQLKINLSKTCEKQSKIDRSSKAFDKKLRDMASSSIVMNKVLISNQNTIEELKEELEELQIQLDSGEGLETKLRESLKQVQERSYNQKVDQEMQLRNRKDTSVELKGCLEESLKENKELAIIYIDLQSRHISEKNKFINAYEKAVIAQDSLEDKKALCELHSRLHDALKYYYQLRGIQTKAGLARFEDMTRSSNRKLENIQYELEATTRNISVFLNANNKSHKLIQLQNAATRQPIKMST